MNKLETSNKAQNCPSPEKKRLTNPIDRFKAKSTRKYAIYAHCYKCMGSGADSWWKEEIGNCQIKSCPLWKFRPYQQRFNNG